MEILQGEPDADRDDCLLIGEIVLSGLPKEAKRTPRIQVEYCIDGKRNGDGYCNRCCVRKTADSFSGLQEGH